ncbi:MAG: alpha/beta fold hydrolase [Planctomycetes bacterium]|nr:alpha/beta fold hydrolase [Planctomycetota bacterium]
MKVRVVDLPGAVRSRRVHGRLTLPDGTGPFPLAIFVHGFTISCEWGFWPELARRLAASGIASLRFNASGDGFGADLRTVDAIEAVAVNTYGKELVDLASVRAYANREPDLDARRAALVGHSRGGAVALLHARDDGRYRALALWAASDKLLRFNPSRKALWRARGAIDVTHFALDRRVPLLRDALDEVEDDPSRFDVLAATASLASPVLVMHGAMDRAISVGGAHAIARAGRHPRSRLRIFDDAGHSFGARDPLPESAHDFPARLTRLLDETVAFLARELSV